MKIYAYNPDVSRYEKTFISAEVTSGATTVNVKNTNNFTAGDVVLIGSMGREKSETTSIASVTDKTITFTTALKFSHNSDDPVYVMEDDQIRFYRSTSGQNGVYSLLATIDVDVDNADKTTRYTDDNSMTDYWYQTAFYSSVSENESERSAPIQSAGYPANSVGSVIQSVVSRVRDTNYMFFSIEEWIDIMNEISEDMLTQARRPYRFLKKTVKLDVDEGDTEIPFPADSWKVDYVEVNRANPVSMETIRPKKVSATELRFRLSQTPLASDEVYEIAYDEGGHNLLFNPPARTQRIDAFNFHYYKTFDRLVKMSDELETPYSLVYKLGMWKEFYKMRADDDRKYLQKAQMYESRYNAEMMKLQREKSIEASGTSAMGPDRKRYSQWGGVRRYHQ